MLLVRDVFQARYGHGDELVALFKEIVADWQSAPRPVALHDHRVLTDASGPFFTVVTELVLDDFTAWERFMAEEFALPQFPVWFERMTAVTESGRREFYNLVS
jgi:hypothetical protein